MSLSTDTILDIGKGFPEPAATLVQGRDREVPAYEVDTLSDKEWDDIVAGFEDVSYEQTAAYCVAIWGEKKNSHLLLRDGANIIAAAHVLEFKIPGLDKGLAYVKFGPLWRRTNQQPDPNDYCSILAALNEEYCNRRGLVLSILPRASPEFGPHEKALLEANGFNDHRPIEDSERYLVDLSLDEETQLASLGQTWRRNLRKSESSDLDIRFGVDTHAFEQFQTLHSSMVTRKNASHGDAVHVLPHLENALPEKLAPKIIIAYHEGKPIAGAAIALHGDTAYYVYGATAQVALPLRAGYALQWWIVRWLSDQGVRWYDLGGTGGDSGLVQFKTGLVGRQGKFIELSGEYLRFNNYVDRIAAEVLFSLRACHRQTSRFLMSMMWR